MHAEKIAVPADPGGKASSVFVGCGEAMGSVELKIIDKKNNSLPERSIGEIVIKSRSLFSGYLTGSGIKKINFKNGWFHTGDMGYMAEGQLYICGRKSDLIISSGMNVRPEELEAVAEAQPEIRTNCCQAIGIMDEEIGTERIILLCELVQPYPKEELYRIERDLRKIVFLETEMTLNEIHFFPKGWIHRTLNGKLMRRANFDKFMNWRASK
jgi:acyl-CoA synthetase (AMP-forming)/AMP-acid ligase II